MYEEEKKALVKYALDTMLNKVDYDSFLDVFKDRYNWFGRFGVCEEDYQEIASDVNEKREELEKPKVLVR